jgi:polar amino acid transport system permease protein
LSLYGGAFYAEIIRAGVLSIDAGQWDAGRSLGLGRLKLMRKIILPQALKRMLPPLMNQSIIQLKNTSLVSVLAVPDLLYQGQVVTAAIYRPLEVYTMVALVYFAVLFPLTLAVQGLERRLAAHA